MRPLVLVLLWAAPAAASMLIMGSPVCADGPGLSDLYLADHWVLKAGDPDWNEISLTIDDGPNPLTTPRLLQILAEKKVQATFFLIGHRAQSYPDLVARIAEAGHELGNHTWSHARLRGLGRQEIMNEIERGRNAVEAGSGLAVRLFRPPGGGTSDDVYAVARELGATTVLWTLAAGDYDQRPSAEIARSVLEKAKSGSIIVMHDGKPEMLGALPEIIDGLRARGLSFVPAGRWAERCRLRSERRGWARNFRQSIS